MPEGGGSKRERRPEPDWWGLLLILTLSLAGCQPSPARLVPPERIDYLDGQASFYLRSPEGVVRFRLNFYYQLEDRARLELYDPLGRLQAIIWLNGDLATLYIPADRVFWEGDSQLITTEVFGRKLSSQELAKILAGRWSWLESYNSWELQVDEKGSVVSGRREGLSFEIKDTFAPGQVPKTVHFISRDYNVRIRLVKLNFNRPRPENVFQPSLPAGTRKLEWEEISDRWKK